MTDPVTPAQEAVTAGMLGGLIVCTVAGYLTLRTIRDWVPMDAAMVVGAGFVVSAYIVPHLVAYWIGCPLHDIMQT